MATLPRGHPQVLLQSHVDAVLEAVTRLIETRGPQRDRALADYHRVKRDLDEFVETILRQKPDS